MESTTIKALFGRRNIRFVIPEYQRAYAWGERQFSQFVEDLRECEENYYLGHFLFEQSDDTLYVIDGQQRLTTCIIFFSTLVNALKHRHEEWDNNENADDIKNLLEDITDYYLKDIRRNKQKFMTVPYDNNFFVDAVIENKESVSEEDLTSKSRVAMYKARNPLYSKCFLGLTRWRTHPLPLLLSRTSCRQHRFSHTKMTEVRNLPIWKFSKPISCYRFSA